MVAERKGQGLPIPKAKPRNRVKPQLPYLSELDAHYLDTYRHLQKERPPAFSGLAPIPWSRIHEYATRQGWRDIEKDLFIEIMLKVDEGIIKIVEDIQAEKEEQRKREQKRKSR